VLFCILCTVSIQIDYFHIRFQNIRVPRENLLNLVADVFPDGQYVSVINDPDQVP
jgi:acyl-CoA oxidase